MVVNFSSLWKPTPRQQEFLDRVLDDRYKYCLYGGAKGGGKLLSLDTPIPTPNGWVLNKDIKIGDFVFGEDGKPVVVIHATEICQEEAYRLGFSDGTFIVAGVNHLWKTMTANERRSSERATDEFRKKRRENREKRGKGKRPDLVLQNSDRTYVYKEISTGDIRTTKEIVSSLHAGHTINHSIRQHSPLELPKVELIIPPYTFGAWLGDGTSACGDITGIDKEIFNAIKKDGFEVVKNKSKYAYRICGLTTKLHKLDVLNNKHIPKEYLRASFSQRLALLQGIMDTDGWCDKDGSCAITLKSKKLFDGVVELARTLGIIVNTSIVKKTCTNSPTRARDTYFNAKFVSSISVFRLKRKRNRQNLKPNIRYTRRFITSAESIGIQPMRCIQVGNPDGMYLAGEQFIPTHNSNCLRWTLVYLLLMWAREGKRNVRVGLFCEDYTVLKDRQATKMQTEFPDWLGTLSENKIDGLSFILKPEFGGGIIALRNLDEPSKYNSSEFAAIAVDEITMNPESVFLALRGILRWPGIKNTKFIAGTNPIGIGMEWVKRLWIERNFPEHEEEAEMFTFVQSLASDNPHNDPNYIKQLSGLTPELRRAYLEGSWDTFEGQAFNFNEEEHVVDEFTIPPHWLKIRGIDHGRTAPTCCLWYAVDEEYNVWIYREYYKTGVDADVNAGAIRTLSEKDECKYWFTVMDAACWAKSGAETIADIYAKNGVVAEPSSKHPTEHGLALIHEYLRMKTPEAVFRRDRNISAEVPLPTWVTVENGMVNHPPKIRIFRSCTNLIKEIKNAVIDEKHPEKLDPRCSDHAIDPTRYVLEMMSEGRSRKQDNWLQKLLRDRKKASEISPNNLNRFYANKL